ncbi:hypothetical protein JW711_01545 [Candidatus Woesearchaeota archaeon]|nr:hypothetical protein [Candidatus Woesearchaeota archaeon]
MNASELKLSSAAFIGMHSGQAADEEKKIEEKKISEGDKVNKVKEKNDNR